MENNKGIARSRLKQIFSYLKALNEHRNPVVRQISEQQWSYWFRDLPKHPSVRLRTEDHSDLPLLSIRRPKLVPPPQPPKILDDWLEVGWDDSIKDLRIKSEMRMSDNTTLLFSEDSQRVDALDNWGFQRNQWAIEDKPARAAKALFEKFYSLYEQIRREGEKNELVLGNAILAWKRQEGGIKHPILFQRLQLEFEPLIPEFNIVETSQPVELYSALFSSLQDVDARSLSFLNREIEEKNVHPMGDIETTNFLKKLVLALSPRGQFETLSEQFVSADFPRIWMDPVLFIRSRAMGFARAVESVISDLQSEDANIPDSLCNIAGIDTWIKDEASEEFDPVRDIFQDEILFAKPANIEQMQIAKHLERNSGVLVQGPPGTGKSHTIANLIGHLLAQGKQILVTSHTTKALRVLRSHLPEELQSLCVSLLESDTEGQEQLKQSVTGITSRLQDSNVQLLEREARDLQTQRAALIRQIKELTAKIKEARTDEYREIEINGKHYSPSEAARINYRTNSMDGWIPDTIPFEVSLPVAADQIKKAYFANGQITIENEKELHNELPEVLFFPTDDIFEQNVTAYFDLNTKDRSYRSELWTSSTCEDSSNEVEELSSEIKKLLKEMAETEKWSQIIALDGKTELGQRWNDLISRIEHTDLMAKNLEPRIAIFRPEFNSDLSFLEQKEIVHEIVQHIKGGGSLGFFTSVFHRTWIQFASTVRLAHQRPSNLEHFTLIFDFICLQIERMNLREHWDHIMKPLGGPIAPEAEVCPERFYKNYIPTISYYLEWFKNCWNPFENSLIAHGMKWREYLDEQRIKQPQNSLVRLIGPISTDLSAILAARWCAIRFDDLQQWFASLKEQIQPYLKSKVGQRLYKSIQTLNSSEYKSSIERLKYLHSVRAIFELKKKVINQLALICPKWALAMEQRTEPHHQSSPPGDIETAWEWRQLEHELKRRSSVKINELLNNRDKKISELQVMTGRMIEKKSWAAQVRRNSLDLQQALIGWLQTIKNIGRGFGKMSGHYRQLASSQIKKCREAVPVWIMPLARMVEQFFPLSKKFDVVIIDEASQSDVMALLALYVGKKVIVVGDDEQVSPLAVGQNLEYVNGIIEQYLENIPNRHLYDGRTSIYDLAKMSFPATTCLLEHFRCVPEIIGFSNALSYDHKIRPLREAGNVQTLPHTISYRVRASYKDGKVNRQEASVVASLLIAATEQPEYERKTFGVISLVGEEQAIEIAQLLHQKMNPREHEERQIVCGNAAQFQGDERDVMFLSIVDVANDGSLSMKQEKKFQQRFNVAASRARDQMWVIHSLDSQVDLKPGDLRKRLIDYAENPLRIGIEFEKASSKAESPLEEEVIRHLLNDGYKVIPQFKVGSYRIDIVVYDGNKRLAIECDGERFHPIENLDQDMARQAVLERLGWNFHRIRGSEFYRDPNSAMQSVYKKLASKGINPSNNADSSSRSSDENGNALKLRIVNRARELRRNWGLTVEGDEDLEIKAIIKEESTEFNELEYSEPEENSVEIRENLSEKNYGARNPVLSFTIAKSVQDWASKLGKDTWFAMAHYAKQNDQFSPKARSFLYQIGVLVASGKSLTEKQEKWARELHQKLVSLGFSSEANPEKFKEKKS